MPVGVASESRGVALTYPPSDAHRWTAGSSLQVRRSACVQLDLNARAFQMSRARAAPFFRKQARVHCVQTFDEKSFVVSACLLLVRCCCLFAVLRGEFQVVASFWPLAVLQ